MQNLSLFDDFEQAEKTIDTGAASTDAVLRAYSDSPDRFLRQQSH